MNQPTLFPTEPKRDANIARLLRETPASDQPLTRIGAVGPTALATRELLQIALDSPGDPTLPLRILQTWDTVGALATALPAELARIPGMTPRRIAQLRAALELGRRAQSPGAERQTIHRAADLAALLQPEMAHLEHEQLRVALLNTKNQVVGVSLVYQGSLNTTVIRVGEIFRDAVRAQCSAIALAHNHPSGDPTPSPEDVAVTREIVKAGKLLDVDVLDHLVIGNPGFVSLKERGLGFS